MENNINISLNGGYIDHKEILIQPEELNNYMERKKSIFKWYKFSNDFIEKIDQISSC